MNAQSWLAGPLAQAVGWALVHLLWQGAIIAALLAVTLALMQRRTANARYVASCAALALLLACGVATGWRAYGRHETTTVAPRNALAAPSETPAAALAAGQTGNEDARAVVVPWRIRVLARLPQIVLFWLLGVTLLSLRLVSSWTRALRLTRAHAAGTAAEWQGAVRRLAAALRLRRAVRLVQSAAVEVPTVVGWLRPIILLPVSALAGLSSEQLEMVLAHELAHIRRHDFLINLLQSFVETLLFYHPAVWWMSRRVRVEREHCCDDLAVAVCGDPLRYARALTRLEELRPSVSKLALAANGGSLLGRIRRLVGARTESTSNASRWIAGAAVLMAIVVMLVLPSATLMAQKDDPPAAPAPPAQPAPPAEATPPPVAVNEMPAVPAVPATPRAERVPMAPPARPTPPTSRTPLVPPAPRSAVAPSAPRSSMTPPAPPAASSQPAPMAPPAAQIDVLPDIDEDIAPPAPQINVTPVAAPTPRPSSQPAPRALPRLVAEASQIETDTVPPVPQVNVTPPAAIPPPRPVSKPAPRALPRLAAQAARNEARANTTKAEKRHHIGEGGKLSVDDLITLRTTGVTPEYIEKLRAIGLPNLSLEDVVLLHVQGVTSEYIQQMRGLGLGEVTARDLSAMYLQHVTPDYLREMRDAGVEIKTSRDAIALRVQGVKPEFVRMLAGAGYTNLTAHDLVRLAAVGVNSDFIQQMSKYRTNK